MRYLWLPLLGAVTLAGCAQTTLTQAGNLAKAGQTAAAQMHAAATLSADQTTALKMATAFHRGFMASGAPTATQQSIDANIANIETELSARAQFLDSLGNAYAALGALSSYGATSAFDTAYASLMTDSNALLKTLKAKPLPNAVPAAVETMSTLFVGLMQKNQVIAASKAMRTPLNAVIAAMSDNEAAFTGLNDICARQTRDAAIDLYASHMFSVTPVLDQLAAPLGLKSVANADQLAAANPRVMRGLTAVVAQQADQQDHLVISTYDKSIAALKALLPLHDALEHGSAMDQSRISIITVQIQSLVTQSKPTKGN
jgi:hypothetical protein